MLAHSPPVRQVAVGSFEMAGRRGEDRMEDCHVVMSPCPGASDTHLVGLFDGHRGKEAAEFSVAWLGSQVGDWIL